MTPKHSPKADAVSNAAHKATACSLACAVDFGKTFKSDQFLHKSKKINKKIPERPGVAAIVRG